MATSQDPKRSRRRPSVGDGLGTGAAAPPGTDPTADLINTPGHPEARGTLPMARYLTDPAIEEEIQALAAEAALPTTDQAARLARLLRLHHRTDAA
jgi:hypothetical protein